MHYHLKRVGRRGTTMHYHVKPVGRRGTTMHYHVKPVGKRGTTVHYLDIKNRKYDYGVEINEAQENLIIYPISY